ncbi:MAG: PLP-dependent aminotransferase family protein [Caldiserica bacterium]|nr:PLP-dependent aminotransferase family protein [Caldisericota bacterium]
MERFFSQRARDVRRSVLRELLKFTQRPEIISFAGGTPDPGTFPWEELADIAAREIREDYARALQYSTTEGDTGLREELLKVVRADGIEAELDEIVITTASQQGLDLIARTLLDPGDVVYVELPTYLGAIQAFRAVGARLVGIPLEEDGMDLDALRERIAADKARGERAKFIYVIPDFQNPAGVRWSEGKRRELLGIAAEEDLLVVEDAPYRALRFAGGPIPSLKALDREDRVIFLFTLSKILAPGLRIAALIGSEGIVDKIVAMKQAADLCTPALTQALAREFLRRHDLEAHMEKIRACYREKRDRMLAALGRYMPGGVRWTEPEGGLFLWVTLPEGVDTERMFPKALERKVAYVIGAPFFVDGSGRNTMRLSFAIATPEEIEEGIRRLAEVVKEELAALSAPAQL